MPLVEQVRALLGQLPQADLRHLPRQPDPRARGRRRHVQAAVRAPRRESAGAGPAHAPLLRHQPEPRLRRRRRRRCPTDWEAVVRQHQRRHERRHPVAAQPYFSVQFHPEATPGPRGHRVPVRRLHRARRRDGAGAEPMYGAYLPREAAPRRWSSARARCRSARPASSTTPGRRRSRRCKEEGIAHGPGQPEHRDDPDEQRDWPTGSTSSR